MKGEYLEKGPFPTSVFIIYAVVSVVFLITYIFFFGYTFRCTSTTTKCCEPMRFGFKTFLVLSFPLLANALHLTDSIIALICYVKEENLDNKYFLINAYALMVVMVTSLAIVNYYQLKVAGIAAIQKCTTTEEEIATVKRLKYIVLIYLPVLCVSTLGQFVA